MLIHPRRAFIAVIALTMAMLGASVIACVGDEPGETSKSGACAYSLVASRCRTACVGSEIEVCSSSDESCSTGTCRPIRVQAIVAEVSNGACLP